jgi:hypothetical protein
MLIYETNLLHMKTIRIFLVTAMIIVSFQVADAAPLLPAPTETFQLRKPPPPPDPLHLFKRHPRRKVVRHRGGIHIKLPPPPPAPPRP